MANDRDRSCAGTIVALLDRSSQKSGHTKNVKVIPRYCLAMRDICLAFGIHVHRN